MDVDEVLRIRERAMRVLSNGTTSGSARRLAEDALYLADHFLTRSRTYQRRKARGELLARQRSVIEQLEGQFDA